MLFSHDVDVTCGLIITLIIHTSTTHVMLTSQTHVNECGLYGMALEIQLRTGTYSLGKRFPSSQSTKACMDN